jgi:4'-phosphopantetheinyl transferase
MVGTGPSTGRAIRVDVWCITLQHDADLVELATVLLGSDERARAQAFLFQRLRDDFTLSRGALRLLLSEQVKMPPATIGFEYGPHGKPALPGGDTSLRFNVSHSGGLLACAIADGCDVGVDVERHRPMDDDESLARRFFSPGECEDLAKADARSRTAAFFDCWTRKEAFVKARGGGLSIPLDSFRVSLTPGAATLLACGGDAGDPRAWTIHPFEPAAGYSGAVAINAPSVLVTVRRLSLRQLFTGGLP